MAKRGKQNMVTKTKTALVYNPSRKLTIGGSQVNSVKKSRRSASQARVVKTRSNPAPRVCRRKNPATTSGLLVAAVMAGLGVSVFDLAATRLLPQQSALVRAGVKLGGAWLFQSNLGGKIPLLGKHKNDIALVLAVAGVVDLMKLYVFPLISGAASNLLIAAPPPAQITEGDQTTGNIYGNAYSPDYIPYA
jgi:hypothetical protein